MPNLTANLVPTWSILAPLGPSWRQHRLQEASKWSSTGGPDRICGHLGAKRAPKSSTPQKWRSFSNKIVKKIFFTVKVSLTEFCTDSVRLIFTVENMFFFGRKMAIIFRLNCEKNLFFIVIMSLTEFSAGSTGNATSGPEPTLGSPCRGPG